MTALLAFFAGPIGRWLVIGALLASSLFAFGLYERDIQYKKDEAGYTKERQLQAEANAAAVKALDAKYRKVEKDGQDALNTLGANYEKDISALNAIRDRDVANAKSGALRLSINARCPSPNVGSVPGAAPSPSLGDGETRVELSSADASTILAIADDADAIVSQLTTCQAILTEERK